jgi:hypothetical protein
MFLTIRKYSDATSRDEAVKRVEEGLVPQLSESPGFITYYAVDFEDGDLGSVTVFETKEHSDRAAAQAISWVRENLAEILPNEPEVSRGEVLIHAATKSIGKTV